MGDCVRVLIADDNAVVRMGLSTIFEMTEGIEVVGEAASGAEAVELAAALCPDVTLLDVRMPGSYDGVAAARELAPTTRVVMLTYSDDPDVVRAALTAGAAGFLVHGDSTPDEMIQAVRDAAEGRSVLSRRAGEVLVGLLTSGAGVDSAAVASDGSLGRHGEHDVLGPGVEPQHVAALAGAAPPDLGLTARETEIMDLVAQGLDNAEIAERLFISRHTLKNHITRIFVKLGVTGRAQAVATWLSHGPRS